MTISMSHLACMIVLQSQGYCTSHQTGNIIRKDNTLPKIPFLIPIEKQSSRMSFPILLTIIPIVINNICESQSQIKGFCTRKPIKHTDIFNMNTKYNMFTNSDL